MLRRVAMLDEGGAAVEPGETGSLAVRAPDPAMFRPHWDNPDATDRKFRHGPDGPRWCLTGDRGRPDADGYLYFRAPVRAGDTPHADITVRDARPTKCADQGMVTLAFTTVNQQEVVVQDGMAQLLMRRTRGSSRLVMRLTRGAGV